MFGNQKLIAANMTLVFSLLLVLPNPAYPQWAEKRILLPDSFGGVAWPGGLTYNSINNDIYVCGISGISIIDGFSNQKIARINTDYYVSGICWNPINNKGYCSVGFGITGKIIIIDGSSNMIIDSILLPYYAHSLVLNEFRNKIYFASDNQTVKVLDCAADTIQSSILVGDVNTMVYNRTNDKIYCAVNYSGRISIIDCGEDTLIKTLPIGNYPRNMAYNSVNNKVYCSDVNNLTVIDGNADSIVSILPQGASARCLTYNNTNNKIYGLVGYYSIMVIDGETNSIINTIPDSSSINTLLYESNANRLYCAHNY